MSFVNSLSHFILLFCLALTATAQEPNAPTTTPLAAKIKLVRIASPEQLTRKITSHAVFMDFTESVRAEIRSKSATSGEIGEGWVVSLVLLCAMPSSEQWDHLMVQSSHPKYGTERVFVPLARLPGTTAKQLGIEYANQLLQFFRDKVRFDKANKYEYETLPSPLIQ